MDATKKRKTTKKERQSATRLYKKKRRATYKVKKRWVEEKRHLSQEDRVDEPLPGETVCYTCHLSYYQKKNDQEDLSYRCSCASLVLQFWSQHFHYHNSDSTITAAAAFKHFKASPFYRDESLHLFHLLSKRISHLQVGRVETEPYYAQYIPDMVNELTGKLKSHKQLLLEKDKEIVLLRQHIEEMEDNLVTTEYEEQQREHQCLILKQEITCLDTKNRQLLEEVSELQKEEKEWVNVLELQSILDGLVLQIKTLENEIVGITNDVNTQLDNCEHSLMEKDEEIVSLNQCMEETEYRIAETTYNKEQQELQCLKLKQEMKCLKENNTLLLGELSELRKEEKEWQDVLEQRSVLDGLVAQLKTLESEISCTKSEVIAHESQKAGLVSGVPNFKGNVESIIDKEHGLESRAWYCSNGDMDTAKENCITNESLPGQNYFTKQLHQPPLNQNLMGDISTTGSPFFPAPPIVPMMPIVPMFPIFPFLPEISNGLNALGKPIPVVHHSGDPTYERIVKRRIEFGPLSTVSAPSAVVPCGAKAWYEVQYTRRGFGSGVGGQRIGWCSSKLPQSREYSKTGVGDGKESYGFDPFHGYKYHDGETIWGKCFENDDVGYVGVALDMVKGEILYSVNGVWNKPLGLAFKGVHVDRKMFPALSGSDATLEVNFGDHMFTYGPPDPSFMKLDIL